MSMYHMVFGSEGPHDRGAVLLTVLGNPNPGRFRDAWVERDDSGEPVIAIYTRNGGGNRDCYCDDYGREHPDDWAWQMRPRVLSTEFTEDDMDKVPNDEEE